MSIDALFSMGGVWMFVITAIGIIALTLISVQFVNARSKNLTPLVGASLAALIISGVLGTACGLTQAGFAIAKGNVLPNMTASGIEAIGMTMAQTVAIALIAAEYALMLAIPLCILAGVAMYRRSNLAPNG